MANGEPPALPVECAVNDLVDAALRVVAVERPDILVAPIRLIYTGFSSHVVTTGSGFVVRVARTPVASVGHCREVGLLPVVARVLPVSVPEPVWRLEPDGRSRFGAMAYRRIGGTALPRDRDHADALVGELSDLLVRLHQTREEQLAATVVPLTDWKRGTIATVSRGVDHLAHELPPTVHAWLVAWREEFVRHVEGIRAAEAVVVHGDFWHDNILVRQDRLAGVLDWEAAALADPAVDIAPVWDIDEDLGARLLDGYQQRAGLDVALPNRIRLFRIARNVGGITWSLDNDDAGEYADSLSKVHDVLHLT